MSRNVIETVMGAVVLVVAAGVVALAYNSSSKRPMEGYTINAPFESATGLSSGSDVRVGGIKVGVVSDMKLDPKTYQAIVSMQIGSETKLPKDSSAAIVSDGLLGSKFVAIEPGGDEQFLAEGGKIHFTQPSVSLETLIGKFMFSGGGVDDDKGKPQAAASPDASPDASVGSAPTAPEAAGVPTIQ